MSLPIFDFRLQLYRGGANGLRPRFQARSWPLALHPRRYFQRHARHFHSLLPHED